MAFYRDYQPVHGDNFPDPKGPPSAIIPQQTIAEVNKQVQEAANAKTSKKQGSYGHLIVS